MNLSSLSLVKIPSRARSSLRIGRGFADIGLESKVNKLDRLVHVYLLISSEDVPTKKLKK